MEQSFCWYSECNTHGAIQGKAFSVGYGNNQLWILVPISSVSCSNFHVLCFGDADEKIQGEKERCVAK